ncbi:hypothetical protein QQP08_014986 [Theobroma cacao]|nr:hypothetical protein QQP08_014986 [Theobroma cacao]
MKVAVNPPKAKRTEKERAMRRNRVRNRVSDSVEHGFDMLHRVADRCVIYPLAAAEGAVQGVARGVHNLVTHKHPSDRATGDPGRYFSKPPDHAYGQPVGPCVCYGHPPAPAPPPPPPPLPQFQYHPAYPVPCRPPY